VACDAPATSSSPAASPRWWEAALAEQLKVTSGKVDSALVRSPGRLVVDDDGPGIPPDDRERVFERFARGARPRAPGSGLGLVIVAQQAELHGDRAWAEESPVGGARIVVTLNAAVAS
jgi:two-component system, OmpR family, sensor histidine kinase PrrB